MTIGEVAAKTGVRTSALRFYEDAGIFPPVPRVRGQRRYDEQLVRMIEVLGFAQRTGFTLAEIRTLFNAAPAEQMKEAIRIGMSCGCVRLDDCIVAHGNRRRGTEKFSQGGVRR